MLGPVKFNKKPMSSTCYRNLLFGPNCYKPVNKTSNPVLLLFFNKLEYHILIFFLGKSRNTIRIAAQFNIVSSVSDIEINHQRLRKFGLIAKLNASTFILHYLSEEVQIFRLVFRRQKCRLFLNRKVL